MSLFDKVSSGRGNVAIANSHEIEDNDPGLRRPYLAEDGKIYVDVTKDFKAKYDADGNYVRNAQGSVLYERVLEPQLMNDRVRHGLEVAEVTNATVLRKDQWISVDTAVGMAIRKRLRFYADIRAANTRTLDGYSLMTLEREIMTDDGEAMQTMDGLAEPRNWASELGLESTPLPITHAGFFFSRRFLTVSRNRGQGLDVSRGEQAARRCGELVEKVSIGIEAGIEFGTKSTHLHDSKNYGATNHPARITVTTLTASATIVTNIASTGPKEFVDNVNALIDAAVAQNFFGPYVLYLSTAYDNLVKQDYLISNSLSSKTIRSRVLEIDTIQDIRRLDHLTGDVMILVQMDSEFIEAINGMEFTTVQYDTKGGEQVNFRVMGIQLVRFKPVYVSNVGGTQTDKIPVVHGTTS